MPTTRVAPQPSESRDNNGINSHLKIHVSDILAEPGRPYSFDMLWFMSTTCYDCCRDLWYNLLSLCCGPCLAGYWGCEFAFLAFAHIWCISPFIKNVNLCVTHVFHKCFKYCMDCCILPWTEACGSVFHNIRERPPDVKEKPKPKPKLPPKIIEPEEKNDWDEPIIVYHREQKQMLASVQRQLGLYL